MYTSKFANLYYGVFDIPFSDKPPTAMKLVTYGPTEIVVGVHCIGMGVDEMMQGFGVAVKMGGENNILRERFILTRHLQPTHSPTLNPTPQPLQLRKQTSTAALPFTPRLVRSW